MFSCDSVSFALKNGVGLRLLQISCASISFISFPDASVVIINVFSKSGMFNLDASLIEFLTRLKVSSCTLSNLILVLSLDDPFRRSLNGTAMFSMKSR